MKEKNIIEFFMPMEPPTATAQEKGINKKTGAIYLKSAAQSAREKLQAHLWGNIPKEPLSGPVELNAVWLFKTEKHQDGEFHTSKPDLDNLEKDLLDSMTRLKFWSDDKQVAQKNTAKRWTTKVPGIYIKAEELT